MQTAGSLNGKLSLVQNVCTGQHCLIDRFPPLISLTHIKWSDLLDDGEIADTGQLNRLRSMVMLKISLQPEPEREMDTGRSPPNRHPMLKSWRWKLFGLNGKFSQLEFLRVGNSKLELSKTRNLQLEDVFETIARLLDASSLGLARLNLEFTDTLRKQLF